MMKKTILTVLLAATVAGSVLAPAGFAQAQEYGRYRDWNDGPPRRHHHHNGGAIAGGVAAGLIGGLIGGAIVNGGGGGYGYAAPPPPPPRCWSESRPVQNEYDDGWHYERMRVCD